MDYSRIKQLRSKLFFTVEDVASVFSVKEASARVLCSRHVKEGSFVRVKNNFYLLEQTWRSVGREDLYKLSNFLQVPSYISFMTALSYYGITTQVQNSFFESASQKRSYRVSVDGRAFNFYKLQKRLYFDFVKKDGVFMATREKAFVDALYLYSFGKYKLDFASLDLDKLDTKKLMAIMKKFPRKTQSIIKKICKI